MNRRTASLILAMLLALPALAACGDAGSSETAADTSASVTETTPAETETTRYAADLPARDFDGETMTFFARVYQGDWSASDLMAHEQTGEQINDALYQRTAYIEDTYNIVLDYVESGEVTVTGQIKTFVTAGENAYQAIVCDAYDAGAVAVEGMLYDLNEVENIDLSREWWSQSTNGSLSLGGKLYYGTGDIFIVDNKATRVFYFNKDMILDLGLDDPYTLVREGKWTLETFSAMMEEAMSDVNGDGAMNPDEDRFGIMAQPNLGSVLYFAAGYQYTAKDGDDYPYFACDTEGALEVMMGIVDQIGGSEAIFISNEMKIDGVRMDNLIRFMETRTLFAPDVLLHIETMRESEVDIGILPPPKYNEDQDGYYCYADGWCVNVLSVPVTNLESEKAGFILEAMSAESMNNLTPAYYEVCLTDKYVRDEDSVEMLDLILSSMVMDNANIFTWGGVESAISDALYKGGAVASVVASKKTAVESAIDKTMEGILG